MKISIILPQSPRNVNRRKSAPAIHWIAGALTEMHIGLHASPSEQRANTLYFALCR
jgi:hypothetical protein